jgi:hypothetical protein
VNSHKPLNLFYEEPDPDRWFSHDKYVRRIVRRLVRGRSRPGGHAMIAINLMKGLDKLGVPYLLNDHQYIRSHPDEIACIIGKPQVLFENKWKNPILFGAAVFSHPIEHPDLFKTYPNIQKILVPGEWAGQMFAEFYGDKVAVWPAGIDTDHWKPYAGEKTIDFLVYDKIMWDYEQKKQDLLTPIIEILKKKKLTFEYIRYGQYKPDDLLQATERCRSALFLCEHETQGFAYQQLLAAGLPVLAWDKGGYWIDPSYYPHKVTYQPVSSTSYWDNRCGLKFKGLEEFEQQLDAFLVVRNNFKPRDYILENLTLENCAAKYLQIYADAERNLH